MNLLFKNNGKATKKEYYSQYYTSSWGKEWIYVNVYNDKLPFCPTYFQIYPDSVNKKNKIIWQLADDSQRNITKYFIYKRNSIEENWRKIVECNKSVNYAEDFDIKFGEKYIYAISTVNMDGIESVLSSQIMVELNDNYAEEKEEKEIKFICGAGDVPNEPFLALKENVEGMIEPIIAKNGIKLKVSELFNEENRSYIIRITSLDTHLKEEIKLVLKNVNMGEG